MALHLLAKAQPRTVHQRLQDGDLPPTKMRVNPSAHFAQDCFCTRMQHGQPPQKAQPGEGTSEKQRRALGITQCAACKGERWGLTHVGGVDVALLHVAHDARKRLLHLGVARHAHVAFDDASCAAPVKWFWKHAHALLLLFAVMTSNALHPSRH